jgi:hypothetical protein
MQTAETFAAAREAAREIADNRGELFKPYVVSMSGVVGGRDHNPRMFWGHAVRYTDPARDLDGIKFWPDGNVRDPERSLYIVDGVGMYVAGWEGPGLPGGALGERAENGYVLLHPIGIGKTHLLPRRTYVMTTSPRIPALKGAAY